MKTKIFVAAALLIMTLCLSGDTRIGQAAAPTFNTTYVRQQGDTIRLKGAYFQNFNTNFLTKGNKSRSCLKVKDQYGFQGGISAIKFKYKNKHYKRLVGYGNLIPLDFIVKRGNTKNFFNKPTRKLLNSKNIKFTISDSSIASVSSTGTVKGKKCGSTTIKVKWKSYTGYCKIFVLPSGLKKEDVYDGYMLSYANYKTHSSKNDYKYFINSKAVKEMNSKFTGNYQNGTFNHDQLQLIVVSKRDRQNWKRLIDNNAAAIYRTSVNKIIVRNDMNTLKVLLHQFGHFIDHHNAPKGYAFLSEISQYQNNYNQYKYEFKDAFNYIPKDTRQYFADTYALYILSPFYMKKHMPNTYKWMNKFMRVYEYV